MIPVGYHSSANEQTAESVSDQVTARITASRLLNQRLTGARFTQPEDVVSWMGAVQAQEYLGAKWALALRMERASDAAIESAFARGAILRTHVLRPTWHFVTVADIRWMLTLTGPRVSRAMASYNRRLELDAAVFRRSQEAMARALRGGVQLTRQELKAVLQRAGVQAGSVQRLAHIVMQAEVDAVICSGALRSGQFTYALFDERVATSRALSRDEALAELTRRYFTSHGPAQIQDFVWWSGLKTADARAGLAMVEQELAHDTVDGRTYWFSSISGAQRAQGARGAQCARAPWRHPEHPEHSEHLEHPEHSEHPTSVRTAYLLPLYDEYLIAYKDRSAALDTSRWRRIVSRNPFSAPIVVGGQVVGGWKRAAAKDRLAVTLMPFTTIKKSDARAITDAVQSYGDFLGLDPEVSWD